jgi:hypothetical protein
VWRHARCSMSRNVCAQPNIDTLLFGVALGPFVVHRVCGVPEHFNLPWHLAKERGLFEKHGVDVEFIDEPLGTGAMIEKVCRPVPSLSPHSELPHRCTTSTMCAHTTDTQRRQRQRHRSTTAVKLHWRGVS